MILWPFRRYNIRSYDHFDVSIFDLIIFDLMTFDVTTFDDRNSTFNTCTEKRTREGFVIRVGYELQTSLSAYPTLNVFFLLLLRPSEMTLWVVLYFYMSHPNKIFVSTSKLTTVWGLSFETSHTFRSETDLSLKKQTISKIITC